MPAPPAQNYANHRRFLPLYHFFAIPILTVNLLVTIYVFIRAPGWWTGWAVAVAAALIGGLLAVRYSILVVQNRIIRLELMMRLAHVLPADTRSRMSELHLREMVGLRFASDAELPGLVERCLSGDLRTAEQIKREIKDWQPDYVRA
jgi:hypothetical protein